MTKEVVEATTPGGVLHPWRRALLPVIASIGATLVPALIYTQLVDVLDEPMLSLGVAGDLRHRHRGQPTSSRGSSSGGIPAIPFLLLLAIASDVLGLPRAARGRSRRAIYTSASARC